MADAAAGNDSPDLRQTSGMERIGLALNVSWTRNAEPAPRRAPLRTGSMPANPSIPCWLTTTWRTRSLKKRSASKPQPDRVFFADRDLGRSVPNALNAAGVRVERHDTHFEPSTPDTEWLREVGRRGWIALSHNRDIRYNTAERDMVMRAGLRPVHAGR